MLGRWHGVRGLVQHKITGDVWKGKCRDIWYKNTRGRGERLVGSGFHARPSSENICANDKGVEIPQYVICLTMYICVLFHHAFDIFGVDHRVIGRDFRAVIN